MKRPGKFSWILLVVMAVSTFNYIGFGLVCYLGFGRGTEGLITVNLHDFASGNIYWEIFSYSVRIELILAIMATYPLQLFVVTDICEEIIFRRLLSARFKRVKQMVFRCGLVLAAMLIALAIPNFGLLISLIGALGCAALQFIAPSMFYLKLFPEARPWRKFLSALYVLFGLVGGVLGTVQTVIEIVEDYI